MMKMTDQEKREAVLTYVDWEAQCRHRVLMDKEESKE